MAEEGYLSGKNKRHIDIDDYIQDIKTNIYLSIQLSINDIKNGMEPDKAFEWSKWLLNK